MKTTKITSDTLWGGLYYKKYEHTEETQYIVTILSCGYKLKLHHRLLQDAKDFIHRPNSNSNCFVFDIFKYYKLNEGSNEFVPLYFELGVSTK